MILLSDWVCGPRVYGNLAACASGSFGREVRSRRRFHFGEVHYLRRNAVLWRNAVFFRNAFRSAAGPSLDHRTPGRASLAVGSLPSEFVPWDVIRAIEFSGLPLEAGPRRFPALGRITLVKYVAEHPISGLPDRQQKPIRLSVQSGPQRPRPLLRHAIKKRYDPSGRTVKISRFWTASP